MCTRVRLPGHKGALQASCTVTKQTERVSRLSIAWVLVPTWLKNRSMRRKPLLSDADLARLPQTSLSLSDLGLFAPSDKYTSDQLNALYVILEALGCDFATVTPADCVLMTSDRIQEGMLRLVRRGTKFKSIKGISQTLTSLQQCFNRIGRDCSGGCCVTAVIPAASAPISAVNPLTSRDYVAVKSAAIKEFITLQQQRLSDEFQIPDQTAPVASPSGSDGRDRISPPVNLAYAAVMLQEAAKHVLAAALADPDKCGPQQAEYNVIQAELFKYLQLGLVFGKRPKELLHMQRYVSVTIPFHDGTSAVSLPLRIMQFPGGSPLWKLLWSGVPVLLSFHQGKALSDAAPITIARTLLPQSLSLFDPLIGLLLSYQVTDMYYHRMSDGRKASFNHAREFGMNLENANGWRDTWVYRNGLSKDPFLAELYGMERFAEHLKLESYSHRYAIMGSLTRMECNLKAISHAVGHTNPLSQVRRVYTCSYFPSDCIAYLRSSAGPLRRKHPPPGSCLGGWHQVPRERL